MPGLASHLAKGRRDALQLPHACRAFPPCTFPAEQSEARACGLLTFHQHGSLLRWAPTAKVPGPHPFLLVARELSGSLRPDEALPQLEYTGMAYLPKGAARKRGAPWL